ncbi:YlbF family regulator [Citroniella saccharovorans]|uniref:YlbF family regulator n=1 Tax=Citroniella saccharovorans TaxID=2053367 RepID=A0AAW9MUR0_9FIRM|nr:YlbF family regulator [Citroniella saccharovorans]MEB3429826.1 YlbF family regulator [Citroniella saccharovorans]
MINVYDKARELSNALKDSEEFKEYKRLNSVILANPRKKEMVDDFRKKAMDFQMKNMGKEEEDKEGLEKLENLQNILFQDEDIRNFLQAEVKFSILFQDINKIIIESVQLD